MDTFLLLLGFFWVLSLVASYKLGSRNADKKLIEYQRETFNSHAANLNKAMSLSREVISSCEAMEQTVKDFDLWEINQSLEGLRRDSKNIDVIISNQQAIYEKVERIPWIKDDIDEAKDEILSGISASKHRTMMARLKSRNIDAE